MPSLIPVDDAPFKLTEINEEETPKFSLTEIPSDGEQGGKVDAPKMLQPDEYQGPSIDNPRPDTRSLLGRGASAVNQFLFGLPEKEQAKYIVGHDETGAPILDLLPGQSRREVIGAVGVLFTPEAGRPLGLPRIEPEDDAVKALPKFFYSQTQPSQFSVGAYNLIAGAINSLRAPGTVPSMVVPGLGGANIAKPIILAGSALAAKQAIEGAPDALEAAKGVVSGEGNIADAVEKIGNEALMAFGAYAGAKHVVKGGAPMVQRSQAELDLARSAIRDAATRGDVRRIATAGLDAADTKAALSSAQQANRVREVIRKEFGPDAAPMAEAALKHIVEARGEAIRATGGAAPAEVLNQLDQMQGKVNNARVQLSDGPLRVKASEELAFAEKHFDKFTDAADLYGHITDDAWARANANGHEIPYRAGYVYHVGDYETPASFRGILSGHSGSGGGLGNMKQQRVFSTYADRVAAGWAGATDSAVDLLRSHLEKVDLSVNKQQWLNGIKGISDPINNAPLITDVEVVKRPDGSSYTKPPEGYKSMTIGGRNVAVQDWLSGTLSELNDPSFLSNSDTGRVLRKINATGKGVRLLVDSFHLGRLAFYDATVRASGKGGGVLPRYQKGSLLLDYTASDIADMAKRGEIPKEWVSDLQADKSKIDLTVNAGINIGKISDAMHQEWVRKIPGIGDFNKFLFEKFQRGAVSQLIPLEFDRVASANPDLTAPQVAQTVAKNLNTRFGNLGRQGLFRSQSARDMARMVAMAPQWNEGLIRSEFGAAKDLAMAPLDAITKRRISVGMLGRSSSVAAIGYFLTNQIINIGTRGHPTWENVEEGFGPKISAWIPDLTENKGAGFFLNPLSMAAEMSHLVAAKYDKTEDFAKVAMGLIDSRSSQVTKPLTAMLAGHLNGLRGKDLAEHIAIQSTPIPIPVANTIAGSPVPGATQRQIINSVGLKTESAPTPSQRIGALAKEYNKERGVVPTIDVIGGVYTDLNRDVKTHNEHQAVDSLNEVLKEKSPEDVLKYYTKYPYSAFTGNAQEENKFYQGLSDEQKSAYDESVDDRATVSQRVLNLLAANKAATPAVRSAVGEFNRMLALEAKSGQQHLKDLATDQTATRALEQIELAETAQQKMDIVSGLAPDAIKKTVDKFTAKQKGLSIVELKIQSLPDEARAGFIWNELRTIPIQHRPNYVMNLAKKGVITEGVAKQMVLQFQAKQQ